MTEVLFRPEYILPGTGIGSYEVQTQIGQGSGAVVYDAVGPDGGPLRPQGIPLPGHQDFDLGSPRSRRSATPHERDDGEAVLPEHPSATCSSGSPQPRPEVGDRWGDEAIGGGDGAREATKTP